MDWVKAGLAKAALKSAIGAALAMGVLGVGQAQAVVVTVDGQQWNVTTFTGTYNDNASKFNTSANSGVMPWWGSLVVAGQFATAVGDKLGFPPGQAFGTGPYFGASVIDAI
jgi:hypothetical protein